MHFNKTVSPRLSSLINYLGLGNLGAKGLRPKVDQNYDPENFLFYKREQRVTSLVIFECQKGGCELGRCELGWERNRHHSNRQIYYFNVSLLTKRDVSILTLYVSKTTYSLLAKRLKT